MFFDGIYAFLGVLFIRSKRSSRVTPTRRSLAMSLISAAASRRRGPLLDSTRFGSSSEMKSFAISPRTPPPNKFSKLT